MITLNINKPEYQYDIYTLTKAFWPEEQIEQNPSEAESEKDMLCVEIEQNRVRISFRAGDVFAVDKQIQEECSVNGSFEPDKNCLKRVVYDCFCEYTGKTLSWGNLTGIRPTKLIFGMLKEEATVQQKEYYSSDVVASVKEKLYDVHRVCAKKAGLGADIAIREAGILEELHGTDGYSVYIGIPFCPSTCLYCSFTSNPVIRFQKRMEEYLAAIRRELIFTKELMKDKILDTVYVGGGTPTALSAEELDILLQDITTILPWDTVKEFTVEAGRADSITEEKLRVMRNYPVTRISVNPQTMKEETLKIIGRHHTVGEVKEAYALARKTGFDNINMDIILGLPGETEEDVRNTVEEIKKLHPESLTVHSLAIKRASRLKLWMEQHEGLGTMDCDEGMKIAAAAALEMDMQPYYLYRQKNMAGNLENTGYAKDGKYGLYNILIMEEVQSIVALGAGSVSKRVYPDGRIERCDNVKDVNLYIDKIEEMIERKKLLFCD